MEAQGIIRKISIGDIKEGITYKVGQPMLGGRLTIVGIMKDLDALSDYGINKYDIFVTKDDGETNRIWKSFENVPVSIEYDIEPEVDETS